MVQVLYKDVLWFGALLELCHWDRDLRTDPGPSGGEGQLTWECLPMSLYLNELQSVARHIEIRVDLLSLDPIRSMVEKTPEYMKLFFRHKSFTFIGIN